MILHTFGDSHSFYDWNKVKVNELSIKIHHLGGITCASFGLQKLNVLDISDKEFDVNEGDIVCFCFGEIDCRCHLCKPVNFKDYKNIIDYIVLSYFEAIRINVNQYEKLITMVYNIVPPSKIFPGCLYIPNGIIGSNEERKEVALYMNLKLKEQCDENNYIFFNIYEKYCDDDGFISMETFQGMSLSGDNVHINNPIYFEEFLENNINAWKKAIEK